MSRYKELLAKYSLLEDCYKEYVKQSDEQIRKYKSKLRSRRLNRKPSNRK